MKADMSNPGICWDRPRLVASWLAWLAALVLVFQPSCGFAALVLMVIAAVLRPPPFWVWNDRHLLTAAIALLVGVPFLAVLMGSESALSFMRTPAGTALLIALWVVETASQIPSYRRLKPLK